MRLKSHSIAAACAILPPPSVGSYLLLCHPEVMVGMGHRPEVMAGMGHRPEYCPKPQDAYMDVGGKVAHGAVTEGAYEGSCTR